LFTFSPISILKSIFYETSHDNELSHIGMIIHGEPLAHEYL